MHKKLLWYELESIPINFIKGNLESGLSLSKTAVNYNILKKINKAFSLVPEYTNYDRVINFKSGGLTGMDISAKELYKSIEDRKGYKVVFENSMVRKNDPSMKEIKIPHFFIGNEVYYFYDVNLDNPDLFFRILKEADRYPLLVWVTKIEVLDILNPQLLQRIIVNLNELIIGCYDEESYMKIIV